MKESYASNRLVNHQKGYVLVGVIILTAVCLLITVGLLQSASGTTSTRYVITKDETNFYKVEAAINKVTAWLQANSQNVVTAFTAANFGNNFQISTPAVRDNQGSNFQIPTLLKQKNANIAVQLTNSSYFGTSYFPTTTNIATGASFNAVSSFQGTDFGTGINVRVLGIWATLTNGDYQPIFRVDATSGGATPEHGVHGVNFIKSALVSSAGGSGYYTQTGDFQTGGPNNSCASYVYSWDGSAWSRGAARANCIITSRDDVTIKSAISGSVSTLKSGGLDYEHGSISGTRCAGSGCSVTFTLPAVTSWATRCAGVPIVNRTAVGNPDDISNGGTLATQCFQDITIPSNTGFRFTTPDTPYYIKNLLPQNNSNSVISFQTIGPGHKYIIYVDNLANGTINGNQLVALNLAPNQLEIYITKDGTLTLNGTAAMNGVITGTTNHTIKFNGGFLFTGALRSNAITVSGNAVMGYDEALGGAPGVSDINFTLFKASQRYR